MSCLGRVKEYPHHSLSSSFRAWWGGSLTRPWLDISHRLARGGEILLLAPGWTPLVVVRRVEGRFSYSPQAGHPSSSFGVWWRVRQSPHYTSNNDEKVQPGMSKRISPPSSVVIIQSMVGRFSFSSQSGPSRRRSVHGEEILLFTTMHQTMTGDVQLGASKGISPPRSE